MKRREFISSIPPPYRGILAVMSIVVVVATICILYATLHDHETSHTLWITILMVLLWFAIMWILFHHYYSCELPPELRPCLTMATRLNLWANVWGCIAVVVSYATDWHIDDMLALYGILIYPTIICLIYAACLILWYMDDCRLSRDLRLYWFFRSMPRKPKSSSYSMVIKHKKLNSASNK